MNKVEFNEILNKSAKTNIELIVKKLKSLISMFETLLSFTEFSKCVDCLKKIDILEDDLKNEFKILSHINKFKNI